MSNLKDLIVNGSARVLGTLYANLVGNASTATKLETSRTIQTNLASTSSASFDGSANVTPGVTGTLAVGNGGTGQTSVANIKAGKDADGNTISSTYAKTSNLVTSISSSSTDTQFPSAKCVYDAISASSVGALNDLTDVTLSSPSNGQVLGYDGTKWVNTTKYAFVIVDHTT